MGQAENTLSIVSRRFVPFPYERGYAGAQPLEHLVDLKTQVRKFPARCFDKRVASQ